MLLSSCILLTAILADVLITAEDSHSIVDHYSQEDQMKCSNESAFCSPWVYCDDGECKCGVIPDYVASLQCQVGKNLSIFSTKCVTYNKENLIIEFGSCIYNMARWVVMIYGIWNLDFFRSFDLGICLGTDTLQTLALDLAIGAYPPLLMLLTYVLIRLYDSNFKPIVVIWKPFQAVFGLFEGKVKTGTSLIDVFCTFFFLTNIKLLSASIDILVPVHVYQLNWV